MAENNIFSYTKRDYESSRKEGLAKIPSLSNGVWTDLNATDPGIIILDYVHALVDMVQYYQDHQALESFITTAKERSNIFRLANQLSYPIRSAKGARVNVKFSSPIYYNNPIKIPKYTKLSTRSGIKFITIEDAYLESRTSEVIVPCMQGEMISTIYEGTGTSRHTPDVEFPENQFIALTATTVDTDYIFIKDNLGRTWNRVDHIIFSRPEDRVYQVVLNPDNSVTIQFGDGERGAIPGATDDLTVTYLLTTAEKGRVGAHAITSLESEILDSEGKYVPFYVDNEEESTGGSEAQSSTSIRELAPGYIKSQGRAVTLSDFEILARSVDGVASAKAYDVNTNPDIPYHEVRVLIIPDSNSSNSSLVDEVYNYLYQRMIPPTNLQVTLPSAININVDIVVKALENTDKGALEYEIIETVKSYFNDLSKHVGEDFYPADLSAKISRIQNVRYLMSLTPNTVVEINEMASASLGYLNVTVQ